MTDISTYRARIGLFGQKPTRRVSLKKFNQFQSTNESCKYGKTTFEAIKLFMKIICIFTLLYPRCQTTTLNPRLSSYPPSCSRLPPTCAPLSSGLCMRTPGVGPTTGWGTTQYCYSLTKKKTVNFIARYVNGNKNSNPRGVKNSHLNIRSLGRKVFEVKNIVKQHSQHILGISEAELRKNENQFDEATLKVPGYTVLFPKSWTLHGYARVIVYVKNTLEYQQLFDLEDDDVQSIWIRAGFKNSKKVYYCHGYREHTTVDGNSINAQKRNLTSFLTQWEEAASHGNPAEPNEVHVCADMNLDCLGGKWLQPDYQLLSLSRLVQNICNTNNFSQLVTEPTRIQFNSVSNTTAISCIDHLYCNVKFRCSKITVTSAGMSDHDMIQYTRLSKEPPIPARTIRKRSYKNFSQDQFLEDLSKISWEEVYSCRDVDTATATLTRKLCYVLNVHAPWVQFQQRKFFSPWITSETKELMKQRDMWKQRAKDLALLSPNMEANPEQVEAWSQYKSFRNKINNRKKTEETNYKASKITENLDSATKTWKTAKMLMDWKTSGTPHQIEVNGQLVTSARLIATYMNEFFIDKVQSIRQAMGQTVENLSACVRIMRNRDLKLSLNHVTVEQVRKLLKKLKNTRSTSIDELDNFAVKVSADIIAEPLHHIIVLSVNQNKFPTSWKYSKVIPLHKKLSQLERKNYRPVAILSPLSKILEKVVYLQLYDYFSRNKIFHRNLHGYRGNRSTQTALLQMYDRWVCAANAGQVSGVVLLDLSAAFDLVEPGILIKKLRIYGLDENFLTWIESYLTNRHQAVWIDHTLSEFLPCEVGVPQGSNLGPLFFLIFYNDLPYSLNCELDVYADDSTLTSSSKHVDDIGTELTCEGEKVSQWMLANKLKLNADKTHLLTVGTSQRLSTLPSLPIVQMDGVQIQEDSAKCELLLGCSIQSDLKWHTQVQILLDKLKTRLTGLRKIKFIVPYNIRKIITQSIFNSVLVYCISLFGGCDQSDLKDLQVLQNKAAQIVTHSPPRTRRSDLYDQLGWLTVNQLITYHTMLTVYKIRQSKEPEYLSEKLTVDTCTGRILIPNAKLRLTQNSFTIRGSSSWNDLPLGIRKLKKIGPFKKEVKGWILENIPRFID